MRPLNEFEQLVLIAMVGKEKATIKSLIAETKLNPSSLLRAVNSLLSRGLVVEERENEFPFRRFIKPTAKGVEIGRKLMEIYGKGGGK